MKNLDKTLSELADKFGTSVEHLYDVLVKQAGVVFWIDIITIISFVISSVILYKVVKYGLSDDGEGCTNYESYKHDSKSILSITSTIIFTVLTIILFALTTVSIGEIITVSVNPEYYALKEILDTISNN